MSTQVEPVVVEAAELEEQVATVEQPPLVVDKQLVARLVGGFRVDGFGTAFWASIFISLLSWVLGAFVLGGSPEYTIPTSPGPGQVWL